MSSHPRRRLALALTLVSTVAGGALAGPVMAASEADSPAATKAPGGEQHENLTVRKAGGEVPDFVTLRKAGGDPIGYIIAVL